MKPDQMPSSTEGPAWSYKHRGYALQQSLRSLGRSRFATFLTLMVLGITMTLPIVFLCMSDDMQRLPVDTGKGQSLTLYLTLSVNDLDGAAIASDIENRAAVASVEYISRSEALATFQTHTEIDDALDLLEENPLPGAIVVYPERSDSASASLELLASQLRDTPGIERVQLDLQWVQRLEALIDLLKLSVVLLGTLLTLTALMVIGNTLRLEMLRHRREIQVTRLLGATRRFVRRPFIYLGALYGLFGSLLAIMATLGIQLFINVPIRRLANAYGSQFTLSAPTLTQLALSIGIAITLGVIGALLALYWQQKQPESV